MYALIVIIDTWPSFRRFLSAAPGI